MNRDALLSLFALILLLTACSCAPDSASRTEPKPTPTDQERTPPAEPNETPDKSTDPGTDKVEPNPRGPFGEHRAAWALEASGGDVVAVLARDDMYETWRSRSGADTWTEGPSRPRPEYLFGASSARRGGTLVILGGRVSDDAMLRSGVRYDAASDTWSDLPELPRGVTYSTVVILESGALLLAGGELSGLNKDGLPLPSDKCAMLDAGATAWREVAPMPAGRYLHAMVELDAGRVLVVGGDDGGSEERFVSEKPYGLGQAWIYNVAKDAWAKAGVDPNGSVRPDAIALPGGRVLIYGGTVEPIGLTSRTASIWQPTGGGRFKTLKAKVSGGGGSMTRLPGGEIFIAGGSVLRTDGAIPFSIATTYIFDPRRDKLLAGKDLTTARSGHDAVRDGDKVLLIGGDSSPYNDDAPQDVEPTWPAPERVTPRP